MQFFAEQLWRSSSWSSSFVEQCEREEDKTGCRPAERIVKGERWRKRWNLHHRHHQRSSRRRYGTATFWRRSADRIVIILNFINLQHHRQSLTKTTASIKKVMIAMPMHGHNSVRSHTGIPCMKEWENFQQINIHGITTVIIWSSHSSRNTFMTQQHQI